ncbi:14461_t:CDS:2, partial [Cetraspora pellucida]
DIWLHALDLAMPKNNTDEAIVAASSHVSQFRRELAEAGVRLPNLPKTSKHFSLEERLRRIQNINTTKIATMQDLADNPECAKELLIWIQDAITTRKLCNPVYSINEKHSTGVFSKFLKLYGITVKRLRKIGGKHASRVHSGQNLTLQHLEFLSRVAMRYKIDYHNSGMYYAEGDTSDSDLDADPEPKPEALAPILKAINENTSEIEDIYDLYKSI